MDWEHYPRRVVCCYAFRPTNFLKRRTAIPRATSAPKTVKITGKLVVRDDVTAAVELEIAVAIAASIINAE